MGEGRRPDRLDGLACRMSEIALAEGGPFFLGWPDRWSARRTVRCVNEHVSTMTLGTEKGARCLACGGEVWLTFPEDKDGPLVLPEPAGGR